MLHVYVHMYVYVYVYVDVELDLDLDVDVDLDLDLKLGLRLSRGRGCEGGQIPGQRGNDLADCGLNLSEPQRAMRNTETIPILNLCAPQ